jgi:hypothetical protein
MTGAATLDVHSTGAGGGGVSAAVGGPLMKTNEQPEHPMAPVNSPAQTNFIPMSAMLSARFDRFQARRSSPAAPHRARRVSVPASRALRRGFAQDSGGDET